MRNCGGYSLTAMICQKASLNNSQPGRSFGTLVDIAGGTARHLVSSLQNLQRNRGFQLLKSYNSPNDGNAFGDSSLCGWLWMCLEMGLYHKIAVLHGKMITNHWIFRYIPLYLINLIFRQTHVAKLERTVKNASKFLWITKIILVDTS